MTYLFKLHPFQALLNINLKLTTVLLYYILIVRLKCLLVIINYGWSHWFSRLPYRVYLYTTIFGFINDELLLLTIVFGLLLWHFNLNVFYLFVLPVTNLIAVSISAITVIKNIKPDPNPFHHR